MKSQFELLDELADRLLDERDLVRCRVEVNWWIHDGDKYHDPDLSHFTVTSPSGNMRVIYFCQAREMNKRSTAEDELYKKILFLDFDRDTKQLRKGTYDMILSIEEMELIDTISKRNYNYNEKD
jgi:hypothetical protein